MNQRSSCRLACTVGAGLLVVAGAVNCGPGSPVASGDAGPDVLTETDTGPETDTGSTSPPNPSPVNSTASKSVADFGAKCDGVTDDSRAFQAAFDALAGTRVAALLPEGTCRITKPVLLRSFLTVIGTPRTTILADLGQVGDNNVAPFDAVYVPDGHAVTTLAATPLVGSTTVSLTANIGTVGAFLQLQEKSSGGWRLAVYHIQAISGTGPYTYTLDHGTRYKFKAGDTAVVQTVNQRIHIIGNGMTFTGPCVRYIEILGAWQCVVEGVNFSPTRGTARDRLISIDTPSYDSHLINLHGDSNGATQLGFSFESADTCTMENCMATRIQGSAYTLQDAVHSELRNCSALNSYNGMTFLGAQPGNLEGAEDVNVYGGEYSGNANAGILFQNGTNSHVYNASIHDNGIGVVVGSDRTSTNMSVEGSTITNNGVGIEVLPSATSATFVKNTVTGNTLGASLAAGAVGTSIRGGEFDDNITCGSDLNIQDLLGSNSSNTLPFWLLQAGSSISASNVTLSVPGDCSGGNVVVLQDAAQLTLLNSQLAIGTACRGIVNAGTDSVAWVEGTTILPTPTATDTYGLYDAIGTLRISMGVDASQTDVPLSILPGAYCNRGTVTANGWKSVAVPWPDLQPGDEVLLGSGSGTPTITLSPGVGFSIQSVAGDTSTYKYLVTPSSNPSTL